MFRLFATFFSLLLLTSLLFSAVTSSNENNIGKCLICHEDIYVQATSYPNMHTVVRDSCTKCHYMENTPEDEHVITSLYYQKNIVLDLAALLDKDEIYDKDNKYNLRIEASDITGKKAKPVAIDMSAQIILNRPEETFNIKIISDLKVESVKKGMLAKAVISWTTDVPSTFEVEYGSFTKNKRVFSPRSNFTRNHKVILRGLRNKSKYLFRVTSRDLNGNVLQSENLVFETYKDFDLGHEPDLQEPVLKAPMLFSIGERKDLFIRVSANTPVIFKVSISENQKTANRPCLGFVQTRDSTIKVCLQCHQQDASHPVGVRSTNPNITVPDKLPTIENGVITCVTCHFAHGGEKDYYLRMKFSKEICAKCHINKYR